MNSTDEVVRLNAVYGLGALERVELLLASLHKDVLASQQQVAPELAPPPQMEVCYRPTIAPPSATRLRALSYISLETELLLCSARKLSLPRRKPGTRPH